MLHPSCYQVQAAPAKPPDAHPHKYPDELANGGAKTSPMNGMRFLARKICQRFRHQHQAGREHQREPEAAAKAEEYDEAKIGGIEAKGQPDLEVLGLRADAPEQATRHQ